MKKIIYILVLIVVGLLLTDLLFVKYFLVSKEVKNVIGIDIDNSCNSDKDCALTKIDLSCDYKCPSCTTKDLSKNNYISLNSENYSKKKNCPPLEAKDILMCPQCISRSINTHYTAACRHNVCKKIRKSVLQR